LDGYEEARFVANSYTPLSLSEYTMKKYWEFQKNFPAALGIHPEEITFLSTGVDM